VRIVQGLAVHIFWAERYGLSLTPQRESEVNLRLVTQKLARVLELDPRPLAETRPLEKRLVCNCRDFSTLLVAILRYQGVPARARCGFGTYFMPNHFEDHWVVEYWKASEARWVMVDAQLDDFQKSVLKAQFDTLDMPAGQFVVAGQAWNLCREKKADPKDFGIFKWHGLGFIRGNVFREVLAFNKIELLPWDVWGLMNKPVSRCTRAERELFNCAANLSAQGSPELRDFYTDNPGFHITQDLIGS
jgi:hypothetical protein